MTAADPPPELGQALHDWHAALARGDRQARLAARLLVDILVAGGLDERLEEIQARQPYARPVPPNPERQEALLDDVLRLATQNVTISAELYRRLAVQEQRIAEIHAASQAAQTLLQPYTRLVETLRRLTGRSLAAARRPSPPVPPVPNLIRLLRLLAVIGVLLLAAAWLAVVVGKAACPQPVQPLLPPPAAQMLVPPAELPPEPRPPAGRPPMPADRTTLPAGSMPHLTSRLPKPGQVCLAGLLLALMLPGIRPAAAASVDCPDAGLLGPALLGSICWDCVFPIRFGGAVIGDGDVPDGAADGAVCVCDDHRGVPHLGLTYGMWEPAGLFEIVRSPGCSPILGGTRIKATGDLLRGSRGGTLYDKGDRAFYHYHMWKFPLLAMLELFTPTECVRDGGVDIDLLYFSELDPTWVYDELAFLANPESAAVASPEAQAACIADAAAATAGHPIDALFWCAGTWGPLYPLAGAHLTHSSMPRNTSLLTTRALAAMHRRGLARRTMGDEALCKARIEPFLPKSQYQFSQVYPKPEANGRHAIGAHSFDWGEWRVLPAVGEDFLHLSWRWLDCCLTF